MAIGARPGEPVRIVVSENVENVDISLDPSFDGKAKVSAKDRTVTLEKGKVGLIVTYHPVGRPSYPGQAEVALSADPDAPDLVDVFVGEIVLNPTKEDSVALTP